MRGISIRKGLFSRTVGYVKAVDGISFQVYRGQTLGRIGVGLWQDYERTGHTALIEPTSGRVRFDGAEIGSLSPSQMRQMRNRLQIIFQDPYGSMNPHDGSIDISRTMKIQVSA